MIFDMRVVIGGTIFEIMDSVESMSGSRFPIMDPQTTYTMSAFVWQIFIFYK